MAASAWRPGSGDLREAGHNIVSQMVQVGNGKCVAEYRLVA